MGDMTHRVNHGKFEIYHDEGGFDFVPEEIARAEGLQDPRGWWWHRLPWEPLDLGRGPFQTEQAAIDDARSAIA